MTFTFRPDTQDRYASVQTWIKRCRKAGLKFKYCCVAEPHARLNPQGKSRWHFHMLLFTDEPYATVKLRVMFILAVIVCDDYGTGLAPDALTSLRILILIVVCVEQ